MKLLISVLIIVKILKQRINCHHKIIMQNISAFGELTDYFWRIWNINKITSVYAVHDLFLIFLQTSILSNLQDRITKIYILH